MVAINLSIARDNRSLDSSASTMLLNVTFDSHPLLAFYDSNSLTSSVSASCARSCSLRRRGDCYSLPVVVPSTGGFFTCWVTFTRDDALTYDVVLGKDWYTLCLEAIPEYSLLLPSGESYPVRRTTRQFSDSGTSCITLSASPLTISL